MVALLNEQGKLRELIKLFLEHNGYLVLQISTLEKVFSAITTEKPRAIITISD